jgi:uncharacterized protein GlcG (DUF336 family)
LTRETINVTRGARFATAGRIISLCFRQLDGQLVGAVAVSGGTSAQDQEIAEAAAAAK